MPALSYGLNIAKKPSGPSSRPTPARRKPIFDDDSGPEDGADKDGPEGIETLGGLEKPPNASVSAPASSPKIPAAVVTKPVPKKAAQISNYADLSTNHTTAKHASTAQTIDPSVYDYDAVYDSLHAKPAKDKDGASSGPKYMSNLLAAAEVRKRDQLRAKEKMLQLERETEGEEFADKEKFVTGAYRAQQEELRRIEAEEAKREEEERRTGKGRGMVGMYKDLLERDEKRHVEAVKAAEDARLEAAENGGAPAEESRQGKSEAEVAREKGAVLNEDGQVVDKRQLLSAGLNVTARAKPPPSAAGSPSSGLGGPNSTTNSHGRMDAKQAMRERQSRMLEAQLEEVTKRAADDEDVAREALERASKSKKTDGDISSAKERYLARKREAEAAKEAGKKEG